jgi:hypothetical protein
MGVDRDRGRFGNDGGSTATRPVARWHRMGPLGVRLGDWLLLGQVVAFALAAIWLSLAGALTFGPHP